MHIDDFRHRVDNLTNLDLTSGQLEAGSLECMLNIKGGKSKTTTGGQQMQTQNFDGEAHLQGSGNSFQDNGRLLLNRLDLKGVRYRETDRQFAD